MMANKTHFEYASALPAKARCKGYLECLCFLGLVLTTRKKRTANRLLGSVWIGILWQGAVDITLEKRGASDKVSANKQCPSSDAQLDAFQAEMWGRQGRERRACGGGGAVHVLRAVFDAARDDEDGGAR